VETFRHRATAIVIRESRVLLVRDEGNPSFALPGGGIDPGEPPMDAVVRELYEETSLTARVITYLFDHAGKYNIHRVFRVEADGEVAINGEIGEFTWWDMRREISVSPHVMDILKAMRDGFQGSGVGEEVLSLIPDTRKVRLK